MIRQIYGMMSKEEKEGYKRLIALEINSYLSKIYKTMKRKQQLKPAHVSTSQIILKHASLGATKMWEFEPSGIDKARHGNIGNVIVVTRGLGDNHVRKQRALFIAAELYVYHAFANSNHPRMYDSIKCQNQYLDIMKRFLRMRNAHDTRDHAVRYVIEEMKEHRLAHTPGKGWHVSIAKLKQHIPEIADTLGSSEKTFKEIFRKQHHRFSPDMLRQEDDLIRKEIEDISQIVSLLRSERTKKHDVKAKRLLQIHIEDMQIFRDYLEKIRRNIQKWELVDKKDHALLKKAKLSLKQLHEILKLEAGAERIDINKVHLVFTHFEKEKINILRDLEMLQRLGF